MDNFIIDAVLISLARKSLKLKNNFWFVILSAIVGATVSIVFPLLKLSTAWNFTLKMPIGILIVLASGKFNGFKEFVYCFYLFLFFTFLLGGLVTAIFWGLGLNFNPLTYSVSSEIPLFVSVGIALAVYFPIKKVINKIYRKKTLDKFIFKCQLEMDGRQFEFLGFLDSGNGLFYGSDQNPVVICGKKAVEKLLLAGALEKTKKGIISINTVSGKSFLSVYKTQKFLIYNGLIPNILYNVMIGVPTKCVEFRDYDVLLGASMVGGTYV